MDIPANGLFLFDNFVWWVFFTGARKDINSELSSAYRRPSIQHPTTYRNWSENSDDKSKNRARPGHYSGDLFREAPLKYAQNLPILSNLKKEEERPRTPGDVIAFFSSCGYGWHFRWLLPALIIWIGGGFGQGFASKYLEVSRKG